MNKAPSLRTGAEIVGVTALVLSLIFVGFEIQQTRDMNLAQLQHDRLVLFHNTMLAALESEPTLRHLGTNVYTDDNGVSWRPEGMDELTRAAALVLADSYISRWEIESRFIEQGFSIRTFKDLESEIRSSSMDDAIRAVWPIWKYPGDDINTFYQIMESALDESD